jgi:hypothetical protein
MLVEPSFNFDISTGYDCGVWVLAHMFAVFRGQHSTGLSESLITSFRYFISCLAASYSI